MSEGKKTSRTKKNAIDSTESDPLASPETPTRAQTKRLRRTQAFEALDSELKAHLAAANAIVRKVHKRKLFGEQGHASIEDFVLASLKDHLPVALDAVPVPPPTVEVLSLPPSMPPSMPSLPSMPSMPSSSGLSGLPEETSNVAPTSSLDMAPPASPDGFPSALSLTPERVSSPPTSARPSKGPLAPLEDSPLSAASTDSAAEPTSPSGTGPSPAHGSKRRVPVAMLAAAFGVCVLSGFGGVVAALKTSHPADATHVAASAEHVNEDSHRAAPAEEHAPANEPPKHEPKREHATPHAPPTATAPAPVVLAAKSAPNSIQSDLAEIVEMAKKLPVEKAEKVAVAPVRETAQTTPHSGH